MSKSVKVSKMADMMGLSTATIRLYAKEDKISYHTTPGGQLFFTEEDVKKNLGETSDEPTERKWAFYVRSSAGRQSSLKSQEKDLRSSYPNPLIVIKDSASGLNENRKGLQRLLNLAKKGDITDVAVTTQDRLARFGTTYLIDLLKKSGVETHILHDYEKEPHEELMEDFMSLIASFSGRFYRMRSAENKLRLLHEAEKKIEE